MLKIRTALQFATAMVAVMAQPAFGAPVPPELASLARQLFEESKETLAAEAPDPRRQQARERGLWAMKRAGIANWARTPVTLTGAGAALAARLRLDLNKATDRDFLVDLLATPAEGRPAALKHFYSGRGEVKSDEEINELVNAIAIAQNEATGQIVKRHAVEVADGETVEIEWRPETGEVLVRARGDGSGNVPEYETALIGRTTVTPDPATGDLGVGVRPAERPTRVLTAEELERIRGSILGEWKNRENGDVYRISAADPNAGDVEPTREWFEQEVTRLRDRLRQTENAKEFVWKDPTTGEILRQQRFRNLGPPYEYQGEEYLIENAEERIADLRRQIADLEAERDGAKRPPADQYDPVGFGENRSAPGAQSIEIEVTRADGYTYTFDEASFDGRRVAAKRTYRDIRDADSQDLPPQVKSLLIASWSPPGWLELEAAVDPISGAVSLEGNLWGLMVTWSQTYGTEIKNIHTPIAYPVAMGGAGLAFRTAWGAAPSELP